VREIDSERVKQTKRGTDRLEERKSENNGEMEK
jgi:hypothetical protein